MTPVTDRSFGLLIAYVIPGFAVVVLWGERVPLIASGLAASRTAPPTVGGFLYITVAAVLAGLVLSTLRWALVDQLHHRTGLTPPAWRHVENPERLDAYRLVVELHYRYYQFYGSSLLVVLTTIVWPPANPAYTSLSGGGVRLGLLGLAVLFLAASRDTLAKYYARGSLPEISCPPAVERNDAMTNGGHHDPAPPPLLEVPPAAEAKKPPGAVKPRDLSARKPNTAARGAGAKSGASKTRSS